jgi:hypothetical protein
MDFVNFFCLLVYLSAMVKYPIECLDGGDPFHSGAKIGRVAGNPTNKTAVQRR